MNQTIDNRSIYTIRGTVQIYDKDKGGSALQLCLETESFEKYIIENSDEYKNLFMLIERELLIICEKRTVGLHNLPYIWIKNYKLI